MKRLLYIIATPREEESRTLQVSQVFLEAFEQNHPGWVIDELNLSKEHLPSLSQKSVTGKYVLMGGKDLYGSLKETWAEILQHIERFKTADRFLISTPMWNFSIPYMLKQYIDLIVQPRHLFQYREDGTVEGFVKNRKMIVITSSGGQYEGESEKQDHLEPYLRTIFGFVGIQDIEFLKAQPMDSGAEKRKLKIEEAQTKAKELGANA